MRPSRGMGEIRGSKMPAAKTKSRRDNTDFTEYKRGGKVKPIWEKARPAKLGKPSVLTATKKAAAKARAKSAGRSYPNMVDNIWAARKK